MNKKRTYIKLFLIILIFIFVILIGLIRSIRKNDNKPIKTNNNINSSNITYNNDVEFDVFNNAEQQPEVPYSDEHLNNFEFKISNIPDEVLEKIKDKDNFYKEIKKFIYLNGLIEATEANFYDYMIEENLEENEIAMRFLLDKVEKNMLLLVMNTETGEIEISNMEYVF